MPDPRETIDVRYVVDHVQESLADVLTGPGGSQVLLVDPSGNVVELFQPADA